MEELDERIALRTRAMMDGGLIEEVRALIDVGLREAKTASRATGYAQALAVIDGTMSEDEAVESIAQATRQLARRQVKWLRPDPRVHWLDVEEFASDEAVAAHVVELAQREAEAVAATLVTRSAAARPGRGRYGGCMMNSQLPSHARVVKAHGAGNSFVVATDRYDDYDPSEAEVATLCSPAFGIGADGFIRAVERDGCGSWTTATRMVRRRRCAATACASSSITCAARASWTCPWVPRWTWRRAAVSSA